MVVVMFWTSLPVNSLGPVFVNSKDLFVIVVSVIGWDRCRWEIEMFFNILKNGCQVEALQLAAMPRIELALSLFMIVAWRIGFLMRLGRSCPDIDCEIVFDREEWQAAWLVARKPLPPEPPKLNEVIRVIASFGGFLGRKGETVNLA